MSGALLASLAERGLALRVAVGPGDVGAVPQLVRSGAAAGVEIGLWPLLADADGRWASCENAETFAEHAREVARAAARARRASPAPLILDLEPPIDAVAGALSGAPGRASRILGAFATGADWRTGARALAGLARDLRGRGHAVEVAAIPALAVDGPARGWERALGAPLADVSPARVSVMLYTTLFEGYSRGALRRRDAKGLLFGLARAARRRYGARAGASLGVVAPGALGDEAPYRDPAELAEDAAIARAAGASSLALYSLDGALARPPLEAWLDALAAGARASGPAPAQTWRSRALAGALAAASPPLWAMARRAPLARAARLIARVSSRSPPRAPIAT